ncbi:MAG: M14 family metallocarboxypeptidase, partial [Nitrospinaceae bacterium]
MDRLKKAVGTTGFHSLAVLKTPTGQYPLVRTILGEGNQKRVLITAGIHGDEPAGVETILHLIETRALEPFLEDWEITLAPCINPTGFEAGTRENHLGQDLNRLFKTAAPPLEVTTVQSLFIHPFHLDVELHEDVDASGFYLYQKERNNPISDLGRKVLAAVSSLVPLNPAPEIEGMPAEDGLISRLSDPEEMDWWP